MSRKRHRPQPAARPSRSSRLPAFDKLRPPRAHRGALPLVLGVMALAGALAVTLIPRDSSGPADSPPSTPVTASSSPAGARPEPVDGSWVPPPVARSTWPADLPPLPLLQFAPPRPHEVVEAVYEFAARHAEVLKYVPCFCGCENSGHVANEDCFVATRDPGGGITWDTHGLS